MIKTRKKIACRIFTISHSDTLTGRVSTIHVENSVQQEANEFISYSGITMTPERNPSLTRETLVKCFVRSFYFMDILWRNRDSDKVEAL